LPALFFRRGGKQIGKELASQPADSANIFSSFGFKVATWILPLFPPITLRDGTVKNTQTEMAIETSLVSGLFLPAV
jgi:hypothetical protein